jgi:hypothetical protein
MEPVMVSMRPLLAAALVHGTIAFGKQDLQYRGKHAKREQSEYDAQEVRKKVECYLSFIVF